MRCYPLERKSASVLETSLRVTEDENVTLTPASVIVLLWLILGFIGALIGKEKGRTGDGFCLGILLGPIGIIIIFLLGPAGGRRCWACRSYLNPAATVCARCGRDQEKPPGSDMTMRPGPAEPSEEGLPGPTPPLLP